MICSRAVVLPILVCAFVVTRAVSPSVAAQDCVLKYETFEYAVPHIDLETCPEANMDKTAFCRASVGGEQVHLFYFAKDGEQCLLKVRSFEEGRYSLELKSD